MSGSGSTYNNYNQNIFESLDNDEVEDQQKQEQEPKQPEQYTTEREESENKTSVTTKISMSGSEIAAIKPLNREVEPKIVSPVYEQESIFACYKCNITKVMLLPVITEEQKRSYCCIKCISESVLDSHFQQFIINNHNYAGSFHNYADKKKT